MPRSSTRRVKYKERGTFFEVGDFVSVVVVVLVGTVAAEDEEDEEAEAAASQS
jgi:hypothetical protein